MKHPRISIILCNSFRVTKIKRKYNNNIAFQYWRRFLLRFVPFVSVYVTATSCLRNENIAEEREKRHRIGIDSNRGLILWHSGTFIMILSQGNNTDSLADLFQYARCSQELSKIKYLGSPSQTRFTDFYFYLRSPYVTSGNLEFRGGILMIVYCLQSNKLRVRF